MEKLSQLLNRLLRIDQDAIKSFRNKEINKEEWLRISNNVSKEYLMGIRLHGFPYHDIATQDVYNAAITLALHLEPDDMKSVFNNYINNRPINQILPNDRAMLIDKICILSGQLQIYGTQYKVDEDMNAELLPLQNEKDIDKIRTEAGLQPLNQYVESVKRVFKSKLIKK